MNINRRTHLRRDTMGLMSGLYNGKSACIGVIENISAAGLLISQIPLSFDVHVGHCVGTVFGPGQNLKISVEACWGKETNKGMYKTIGFHIPRPTKEWRDFFAESLTCTTEVGVIGTSEEKKNHTIGLFLPQTSPQNPLQV